MQIYLLLTEMCNLHCPMCIRGKQEGTQLNFDSLTKLSEKNWNVEDTVILTGGEPTLFPHLTDVIRFFSPKVSKVVLTTNGTTMLNWDELIDIDNFVIQVSVDGGRDAHNAIRGEGMFERTIDFIKKIDERNISYSVATVLSKKNQNSMEELIHTLTMFTNLSYWKISYEMPFECDNYEDIFSSDEWNAAVDHLISITPFKLKIQKIFPLDLYSKHEDELKKNANIRYHNCGGVKDKIYIYPDFTVYPCTCLTDFPLGNLLHDNLSNILDGSEAAKFKFYDVSPDTVCYKCKYKSFCNGGCIGMSYHYFGELGRGDIRCPLISQK